MFGKHSFNFTETWKELIKKAKGIDVGFIGLLLFLISVLFSIQTIKEEILRLLGFLIAGIIALAGFSIYAERKKQNGNSKVDVEEN